MKGMGKPKQMPKVPMKGMPGSPGTGQINNAPGLKRGGAVKSKKR